MRAGIIVNVDDVPQLRAILPTSLHVDTRFSPPGLSWWTDTSYDPFVTDGLTPDPVMINSVLSVAHDSKSSQ